MAIGRSAAVVLCLISLAACPDADSPTDGATAGPIDGGSTTGDGGDDGSGAGDVVWPNAEGPSNSSAWLREHHAELSRIEPRVLVLDVVHNPATEIQSLDALVGSLVAAFREMSRYHGYSDPSAKPFLNYKIDKILDLKAGNGAAYPDYWPPSTPNGWNVGALFSAEFAPHLGYEDPDAPGSYLTMCQLFERGIINELWISAESGTRNIYENQSHLQRYDNNRQPIPGAFNDCTNGCFYDPAHLVTCSVSTRILEINKTRGVGCGTHATGHAQESLTKSIPYFGDNARRFYRFDLDTRYGFSKPDLYNCSYDPGMCLDLPSADHAVSKERWPGAPFDVTGWGQGCGSVHFSPNSRGQYDYYSALAGASSCEGYGLMQGSPGADAVDTYTSAKAEPYEAEYGDCGGGWMVYMGQNMPGLGNEARAVDGTPMLNWWTFLFY